MKWLVSCQLNIIQTIIFMQKMSACFFLKKKNGKRGAVIFLKKHEQEPLEGKNKQTTPTT
jgi:hypothetical protein